MSPEAADSQTPRWLAASTLLVTNLIKLGGLGVALDEIFGQPSPQPVALAIAAFMMAGAQGVEEAALHFFSGFFAKPPSKPEKKPTRTRTRRPRDSR